MALAATSQARTVGAVRPSQAQPGDGPHRAEQHRARQEIEKGDDDSRKQKEGQGRPREQGQRSFSSARQHEGPRSHEGGRVHHLKQVARAPGQCGPVERPASLEGDCGREHCHKVRGRRKPERPSV